MARVDGLSATVSTTISGAYFSAFDPSICVSYAADTTIAIWQHRPEKLQKGS
jgi:hypothetical protein